MHLVLLSSSSSAEPGGWPSGISRRSFCNKYGFLNPPCLSVLLLHCLRRAAWDSLVSISIPYPWRVASRTPLSCLWLPMLPMESGIIVGHNPWMYHLYNPLHCECYANICLGSKDEKVCLYIFGPEPRLSPTSLDL